MMLKEMMNTRQAVKSVEGYNTLSRREQDKIAGESGLLTVGYSAQCCC